MNERAIETPADNSSALDTSELWSDLVADDGDEMEVSEPFVEDQVESTEDEVPEEAAPETAEVAEPVQAEAPPEPKPEPPQAEPEPQPEVTEQVQEPPPEPEAPPQPQVDPNAQQAMRENYLRQLEQSYQLDEKEADLMRLEPEKALPALAARMHAQVVEDTVGQVVQSVMGMLPNLVPQIVNQQQTAQKNESAFFDAWPELKGREQEIARVAQAYRQANPKASQEDSIRAVGVQVWINSGMSQAELLSKLQDPQPEAAPAAPAQPVGLNSPAVPSAQPPQVQPNQNAFEEILREFENE